MTSVSFPSAEVVEAARGRILSMLSEDASMHPELVYDSKWEITLATRFGERDVTREIFADVFPSCGGYVPAGGESEVLSLITSALESAEDFRAHVECAHAFLAFCRGSDNAFSCGADWKQELPEAHDRLNRMLKMDWRPWHTLRIKEERAGAYRLLIANRFLRDRDITGFLPRILLTLEGFCAAPSKGAVARLVTASLLGEEEFRIQVEKLASSMENVGPDPD